MAEEETISVSVNPWADFLEKGIFGPCPLIRNVDVTISRIQVGRETVPLVRNASGRASCSWVASLRNAYGPYARAETDIVKMSRSLRPLYLASSFVAEAILVSGGLAGGNFLNNWNLATNLYSSSLRAEEVVAAARTIAERDPELPVVLRSLTAPLHAELITRLVQAGFILLPSRQIWILRDPAAGAWRRHRDARQDLALAAATSDRWTWVPAKEFTDADFARVVKLYSLLYRERYPEYNPDYTEDFFRIGVRTGFLDLAGLRARGTESLSGVIGMAHRDGVSCTPVLGYDTTAPVEWGLYRLLTLRAFQQCELRRTMLHCSAGAGLFKFSRGAESYVEFAAVWARHLPIYRRGQLQALSRVVKKVVPPYLEKHRL